MNLRWVHLGIFSMWCVCAHAAPLDVKQAIMLGIESSTTLKTSREELRIKELEQKNAWSKFLPQLNLTNTNGLSDSTPDSGSLGSSRLNLNLVETLYDNGVSLTGLKKIRLEHKRSNLKFKIAQDQLVFDILKGFYDYSLEVLSLKIQKNKLVRIQAQLDVIESQYRQGRKTRIDFLRAKARVQKALTDIKKSEESLTSKRLELNTTIGQDPNKELLEFAPLEAQTKDPLTIPPWTLKVTDTREFQIFDIDREIESLNVNLARREFWPRINVAGSLDYNYSNYHRGGDFIASNSASAGGVFTWSGTVTLEFAVWDWFTRYRNVDIAKANEIIKENSLKREHLELNAKIENLKSRLNRLNDDYKINQELYSIENESFRFMIGEYRMGKVSFLDMITALDDLSSAESTLVSSYFSLKETIDLTEFYQGKLHERYMP